MGQANTTFAMLEACIYTVCAGRSDCFITPRWRNEITWSKPYNLDLHRFPRAIFRAESPLDVAGAVKCATRYDYKTQARSGGHSYGNFAVGGGHVPKGGFMIDLMGLRNFDMDTNSWQATVGSGYKLGELDKLFHKHGERAFAHGTCPTIGIGGHATVGGLGPASRMWGTTLDHVVEVEVVTADGVIVRANKEENADLFWGIRGAGAGLGIVTEFVIQTRPEPPTVLEYTYTFGFEKQEEVGHLFKTWQDLVYDRTLDHRFSTLFIVEPLGTLITGTFFGNKSEFVKTGIADRMPQGGVINETVTNWMGSLSHIHEVTSTYLSDKPMHFTTKSLVLRKQDMLTRKQIRELFSYLGDARAGTMKWFIIFSSEGGAISDVPDDDTSYPHRDALMMYQSYAVGLPNVDPKARTFIIDAYKKMREFAPHSNLSYAGYVDVTMHRWQAMFTYWGKKAPQLHRIKRDWDPNDRFRNPQSIGLYWEGKKPVRIAVGG